MVINIEIDEAEPLGQFIISRAEEMGKAPNEVAKQVLEALVRSLHMDQQELEAIVREEVADYAHPGGANADFYFMENVEQHLYTIIAIPHKHTTGGMTPLVVRLVGDKVVIERDNMMSHPLCTSLQERGVPENQIVFAYEGQQLP